MTDTPMTGTEIAWTSEEPTALLRFKGGRLQQSFRIRRFASGICKGVSYEWRDVPSVEEDES